MGLALTVSIVVVCVAVVVGLLGYLIDTAADKFEE
jgi:hypothetical protein